LKTEIPGEEGRSNVTPMRNLNHAGKMSHADLKSKTEKKQSSYAKKRKSLLVNAGRNQIFEEEAPKIEREASVELKIENEIHKHSLLHTPIKNKSICDLELN
jgi:hypothetical protein